MLFVGLGICIFVKLECFLCFLSFVLCDMNFIDEKIL